MIFVGIAAWGIVAVIGIALWINESWKRASEVIEITREDGDNR